jgi:hypothetical protein
VYEPRILWRGQADSEWPLKTTLERTVQRPYTVQDYMRGVDKCSPEIESLTGRQWELPTWPEIVEELVDVGRNWRPHLPHYELLVYLRQHGFPSPLLDWTTSPYIAAYFAFEERSDAQRCAVFAFVEFPEGGKSSRGGEPRITSWGPYVRTDPRHFAQKAWYTTATRQNGERTAHEFCPHHDVKPIYGEGAQDVLIKITMPRRERVAALKALEEHNVNRYTLFQTEDALVQAMGIRVFDLEDG